jgi:hypothetical protein
MTTAGSAGTPRVSFGPFVPPRFGRPSTPPATSLWLVFALLHGWGPLAAAITRVAVTMQRIRTAGGLVPTTLRISVTLADIAGQCVAAAEKALVNARRAVHRVVDNLTQLPVTSTPTAFRGTGTRCAISPSAQINTSNRDIDGGRTQIERDEGNPDPARTPDSGPTTWSNHRPNQKPGIQDQQLRQTPQIATADTSAAARRLFQGQVARVVARTRAGLAGCPHSPPGVG